MPKAKMGSLVIDRKVWVRKRLSLDHIECMVRDAMNGDKLPPLKVDKNTRIVVGGNHRYEALKKIYGGKWTEQMVEVEWLDLPPFEDDPTAWWKVALEDNQHDVERLKWQDRQAAGVNLVKALEDPLSEEGKEMARMIKHTPETWKAFYENYIGNIKTMAETTEQTKEQSITKEDKKNDNFPQERPARSKGIDTPTLPGDVRPRSVNASIMHHAASLMRLLEEVEPDDISPKSRSMLQELAGLIANATKEKAV